MSQSTMPRFLVGWLMQLFPNDLALFCLRCRSNDLAVRMSALLQPVYQGDPMEGKHCSVCSRALELPR